MFAAVERSGARGTSERWTFAIAATPISMEIVLAEHVTISKSGKETVTWQRFTAGKVQPPLVPADIAQEAVNDLVRSIKVNIRTERAR